MKRYNQGFGKLGPMEQADNDGEWVKHDDVVEITDAFDDYIEVLNNDRINWMMKAFDYQIISYSLGITSFVLFCILLMVL